jgi:hypothetical protein
MRVSPFAFAALLLCAIPASATDVHAVLAVAKQRVEATDFRATGHFVRVDENGTRTSDGISIKGHWFPGVLRVLVEITSPADARGRFLLELRPNGQNSIHIAHPGDKAPAILPFEQWTDGPLGAGFSYEDFLEPEYFWAGQTELEETKYGARDCDVVKSTPAATDRTHYSAIKTWLDHTIGFPVYVEKTQKGTGVVKEFTYYGLRQTSGVWSATQVEAKISGRPGSTLLIIDRGSAKANLGPLDFSAEQLIHF